MRLTHLITLLLFLGFSASAQKRNIYFFKNNGKEVDVRDSADFIRVISEPDSGSEYYNVQEFYKSGKKKLVGKTSQIYPVRYEGPCIQFYENGKRKSIFNYNNGYTEGDGYDYYPNGKIYIMTKVTEHKNELLINSEYDSLGTAIIIDGNGYYKKFDDNFKMVIEEGNLKDGKKNGEWRGIDKGLNIRYIEIYLNDVLISGSSIGRSNDTIKYNNRIVYPEYKGGPDEFSKYLSRNIVYPYFDKANNIQGKVVINFVIDEDGTTSDVKVLRSVSAGIDKEAIRVIKRSDQWIPGKMFGRNIKVSYQIPINFSY